MKILSFGSIHMVDELDLWNAHFYGLVLQWLPTSPLSLFALPLQCSSGDFSPSYLVSKNG